MKWVQLAEFTKFVSPVKHDPQNLVRFLPRTDTRLVLCNRKLMRTDIFFTTYMQFREPWTRGNYPNTCILKWWRLSQQSIWLVY